MELSASQPSELSELIRQGVPTMPVARRVTKPAVETITLGKARDAWLASIQPGCLPKTFTIKKPPSRHWCPSWAIRPSCTC